MNRFRTKKKAAPEPLRPAVSSNDDALFALSSQPAMISPTTQLKKSGTSRWKKPKKPIEDVKPALDLASALPASDDFRISLMMPSLSTRFSMLREQDDPRSMLGKASDDSVLQPRRRSRMDFGGLGDIAEVDVSSVKSPKIRPPFAFERQDSFASEEGYGSENGSQNDVMSRARPGEGNVLFGGRQKVYMIPKAGSSSTRSLGKQVYEDDIGKSAFQKYRREREAAYGRSSDESQSFDFGLDQTTTGAHEDRSARTHDHPSRDLSNSPSLSSSERKRSTNSTSHSEARSSTAATSVASQPLTAAASPAVLPTQPSVPPPSMQTSLKRADTKTRRLYEQGLDQHMQDQQTSALSRLNSIQRQRTLTNGKQSPPVLHSTKSASNLHDKTRQPVYALRSQSPEMVSPLLTSFGSLNKPNGVSPVPSGPVSPATPMDLNEHNPFTQALEPGDRGKATAMGAFNKPKQSFDEEQYNERQRQLFRTNSSAANRKEPSGPSVFQQRMGQMEQERDRSDSTGSARSGPTPAAKTPELPSASAYNVFQRAAQMNTQSNVQQFDKSSLPDTHRTFFGDISASDSEEEEEEQRRFNHPAFASQDHYGTQHGRWQPRPLPSVSEHPALRFHKSKPSLAEEDEDLEPILPLNTHSSASQSRDLSVNTTSREDVDSPTLGPGATATPLNGLMHHLRQQSSVSSIFPSDDRPSFNESRESQSWNPKNLDLVNRPIRSTVDSDSPYTSSNPFDLEEMSMFRGSERADGRASHASISPIEGPRPSAQFDSQAGPRSTFLNRRSAVSDLSPEVEDEPSWQAELHKKHTRDTSTATQQERDAFAKELAARQNAIRENMKSMVETQQSRETSPAPTPARKTFGMLRSKPSGESIENVPRAHAPPKAMKMLGLNGPPLSVSSNTLTSSYERGGYSLDIGRPHDEYATRPPMPTPPSRALQQSEQEIRREWQQSRSRENSESRGARPSPASSAGGRSRANSEVAAGRARSRTGPYRDDLEKAMIEGTGSSASIVPELSPMIPRELTPRPSPDVVQSQFEVPRARSNSRSAMTNYFDPKSLQPIQTGPKDRLAPGVPSPATLSPNVYSPAASVSGRPSPTLPHAFAQNMTPPLSGTNTPLSATFAQPPQIPPSSGRPNGVLRKKTISKGDISDPTLISSTSNVDTIDLPEGASLRNGMNDPPPVPPINPRRRAGKGLFGLGHRKESEDSITSYGSRSKTPDAYSRPQTNEMGYAGRSKTPDAFSRQHSEVGYGVRSKTPDAFSRPYTEDFPLEAPPRAQRSQTQSPRIKQSFDQTRSFTMPISSGSPERVSRSPAPPLPVEGGMF